MLPDLAAGSFLPGTSPLHRADPRTKLLLLAGFMLLVAQIEQLPVLLLLWLTTGAVALSLGRTPRALLAGLKPLVWLALFSCLLTLWHGAGIEPVESARLFLRLALLVGATSLLTATTAPLALTDGLARLFKPLQRCGLPVDELALLLALALRFLPETFEEAGRLARAQRCRAVTGGHAGPLRRARQALPLLVPLFTGVLRRGDALAMAMEARCYRGPAGRTRLRIPALGRIDVACAGAFLTLVAAVALLERSLG